LDAGLFRSSQPAAVEVDRRLSDRTTLVPPGKPGARFLCPKPQLGSFTGSNRSSQTKGPLRRPVETTRILIAVGGPRTDCFRSQLRRLGFGQPHQARPRHGCAKIPCGSQAGPSKPELSTLVATGTSYFGPTSVNPTPSAVPARMCPATSGSRASPADESTKSGSAVSAAAGRVPAPCREPKSSRQRTTQC